jgi:hypothetical protein
MTARSHQKEIPSTGAAKRHASVAAVPAADSRFSLKLAA